MEENRDCLGDWSQCASGEDVCVASSFLPCSLPNRFPACISIWPFFPSSCTAKASGAIYLHGFYVDKSRTRSLDREGGGSRRSVIGLSLRSLFTRLCVWFPLRCSSQTATARLLRQQMGSTEERKQASSSVFSFLSSYSFVCIETLLGLTSQRHRVPCAHPNPSDMHRIFHATLLAVRKYLFYCVLLRVTLCPIKKSKCSGQGEINIVKILISPDHTDKNKNAPK